MRRTAFVAERRSAPVPRVVSADAAMQPFDPPPVEAPHRLMGLGVVLGSGGALLVAVQLAAAAGNLGFHAMASRALGPDSYAALSALLVLVLAFAVPVGAVQAALCRAIVAGRAEAGEPTVRAVLRRAAFGGALAGLAIVVAAPLVGDYIGLSSLAPVALLGAFVAVAIIGLVPKSHLLAESRFGAVAVGIMTGVVVRIAVGSALLVSGGGVTSAILASVLGEVCSTTLLLFIDRRGFARHGVPVVLPFREARGAVLAFGGFWLLAGADVITASHYLPARTAGMYAAAATAARALLFAPGAIVLVAFPRLASNDMRTVRAAVKASTVMTVVMGVVGAVALLALRGPIVSMLFGSDFRVSAKVLTLVALSSCALALTNLSVQLCLARGAPRWGVLWAGAAATLLLGAVATASPTGVASLFLAVSGLVSVATFVTSRRVVRRAGAADAVPEMAAIVQAGALQ